MHAALGGAAVVDSDEDVVGDEISLLKLTVPQLKEMLREKRLPVTGIKKVLLERVVAALALDKSASGGATGDQSAPKKQRRENGESEVAAGEMELDLDAPALADEHNAKDAAAEEESEEEHDDAAAEEEEEEEEEGNIDDEMFN